MKPLTEVDETFDRRICGLFRNKKECQSKLKFDLSKCRPKFELVNHECPDQDPMDKT